MFGKKENQKQVDLYLYTIYDSKTQSYEDPRAANSDDDVCRHILNMFRDPKNARYKHLINAEDYSLFRIAEYCRKTGTMVSYEPIHIANLHELRSTAEAFEYKFSGASTPQRMPTPAELEELAKKAPEAPTPIQ